MPQTLCNIYGVPLILSRLVCCSAAVKEKPVSMVQGCAIHFEGYWSGYDSHRKCSSLTEVPLRGIQSNENSLIWFPGKKIMKKNHCNLMKKEKETRQMCIHGLPDLDSVKARRKIPILFHGNRILTPKVFHSNRIMMHFETLWELGENCIRKKPLCARIYLHGYSPQIPQPFL